jgi:two-component system LytT family sensor kinase
VRAPRISGRASFSRLQGSFGSDLLVYAGVVGICYALDYYRKYREREFLATSTRSATGPGATRLAANAVASTLSLQHAERHRRSRSRQQEQTAVSMLVGLSDLLRHTLEHSSKQEVELREEINFIKLYLSIQEMRFSDRLRIEFDVDPATTRALVPNLILQPLTENALRHGIGRSATRRFGGD